MTCIQGPHAPSGQGPASIHGVSTGPAPYGSGGLACRQG